ncbi:MAG: hypothetical protein HQM08_10485 [Candidatus Riflebacteria bacterium]|nr:hypothetical protein [Candidatus Riflebacteria bacterium]
MKTTAKNIIQKSDLPSVFDIITKTYKRSSATANQIIASVNAWAADRGLTSIVPVIFAMIEQESSFNPNFSGGLMQLTKKAKKQLEECYAFDAGYEWSQIISWEKSRI